MRLWIIRTLNVLCIIGVFWVYQNAANERAQVVAEYEEEVAKAKALEKEYADMVAAANQAADDQAYLSAIKYGNGSFQGSGMGFGGIIKLEILVENHGIVQVEILSADGEDEAYYTQARDVLPNAIVEAQSSEVDSVSGATFSSKGIIEAAKEALEEAKKARPSDEELLAEREV